MNLDFDINEFMNEFSKNCSKVQIKNFVKGEVITNYIQKKKSILYVNGRFSRFS